MIDVNRNVHDGNKPEFLFWEQNLMGKISGFVMVMLILCTASFANSIDFGLDESSINSDQIDVKIRPDSDIYENQTITAILYTVRWNKPEIELDVQYLYPFFIAPQGSPVESDGYYYQIFAAVPLTALAMNANEEYIVSSFSYTNGSCANFEIIEDDWTQANNGNVYCELLGTDVTGIIYNPVVEFGSDGGVLSGGGTIYLGQATGLLSLSEHQGFVNNWQKRLDDGDWLVIPFTEGIIVYSEIPSQVGMWNYRCEVQNDTCFVAYSEMSNVLVVDTLTSLFTNSDFDRGNMNIYYDGNKIQFNALNKGGKLIVYNSIGKIIFEEKNIMETSFDIEINNTGIVIYRYLDKSSGELYVGKIYAK